MAKRRLLQSLDVGVWPSGGGEIEKAWVSGSGVSGDDTVSRRVRGRSGFLKTSPVGWSTVRSQGGLGSTPTF